MSSLPVETRVSNAILKMLLKFGGWRLDCCDLSQDLARFRESVPFAHSMDDLSLFAHFPEVRSIAYLRWGVGSGRFVHRMLGRLCKKFYPPQTNLYLWCNRLGPGFVPFHAFSTVVAATRIGRNFTVFQGVTIGHKGPDRAPIIKDNVTVFANATVIGSITIGYNSSIGAGSVVVNDVPDNAVVAGNPARVIRIREVSDQPDSG